MLKGTTLKLAAAAVTIASASGLSGPNATSASAATTLYHVCAKLAGVSPVACLDVGVHNHVAQISQVNPRAAVGFLGPFHIPNDGANWWEIKTASNLCLAWDLNDSTHSYVYAESCQPGDLEEYWANHTGLQFENAEGNIFFGEDAWLWWFPSNCNRAHNTCNLSVRPHLTPPIQWSEGALPSAQRDSRVVRPPKPQGMPSLGGQAPAGLAGAAHG